MHNLLRPFSSLKNQIYIFCWLIILLFGILAYHNSFSGVFLFDDETQILDNKELQTLAWPWGFLQNTRRPLLYFTLALNYHLGSNNVFGYHLFNLIVHLLAGILLFEILRLTFSRFNLSVKGALGFALSAAVFWTVHPLQTQSVTYIIQRAESLMGMFYLMAVWAAIRYFLSKHLGWIIVASLASLLSGLTKEVAVTIPFLIFFYDRAFVSKTFQQAFREHKQIYVGLLVPLAVMFYLFFTVPSVEGKPTAGFQCVGMTPWQYLVNQPAVILHYLKLAFWPHPLVLDYGWLPAERLGEWAIPFLLVSCLFIMSIYVYIFRPQIGFWALGFFILLSPSSSIIPLKDLAFEHRMYLPLLCVIVLAVQSVLWVLNRFIPQKQRLWWGLIMAGIVIEIFSFLTIYRNQDYYDVLHMWEDVARKRPENGRAYYNLGATSIANAMKYYEEALRHPSDQKIYTWANYNLGILAGEDKRFEEAQRYYEKAIQSDPDYFKAYYNLSNLLSRQGKFLEAEKYYEKLTQLKPNFAEGYNNYGVILLMGGKIDQAKVNFRKAVELNPRYSGAHYNLGKVYSEQGDDEKAIEEFLQVLKLEPRNAYAHNNLGVFFLKQQDIEKAIFHFEEAIRNKPDYAGAKNNLEKAKSCQKPVAVCPIPP